MVDDESALFSYHMIAGIVLCFLVAFRVLWGAFGTKYARFTGYSLHPRELAQYFKGILTGDRCKWTGHNPASSWAAIMMMIFGLGLGATGYLMTKGQGGEAVEEMHELLANGFLIVVLLHIAGIAFHTVRHRDGLWQSMFSGQKVDILSENSGVRPYNVIGILFFLGTIGLSGYLVQNFDSRSGDLIAFGTRFRLAEGEDDNHERGKGEGHNESPRKQVDHDDDD